MKKKKIVIIQETLAGGGAERVLVNILNKFNYDKFEVDLLVIHKTGIYLEKIPENVNIKSIFSPLESNNKFVKRIYHKLSNIIIKKFASIIHSKYIGKNYDIEIAFLEGPCTYILSKSKNKCSVKIGWIHIDLKKFRRMSEEEEKECYKKLDHIICVSNESKNRFLELYPKYSEKVKVIYNLINTEEIKELSEENINYSFNEPTIVAVGRLAQQKRFDILIKAHSLLINEGIKHKLLILGEGNEEDYLKKLITELNVDNSVSLHGFVKNPYPFIKNSDIYVMSSDFEGLPLVICEALVLGKAIVSTDCTGPNELLKDGTGLLVPCNNHNELKEAIKFLLCNRDIKLVLERKSIEKSKLFNEDKVLKEIYKIIEEEV